MTTDEIQTLVTKVSNDFDFGKYETRLLIRFYVHKYCKWLTQVAISKSFGVSKHNMNLGLKTVATDPRYAMMKLRIDSVINSQLYKWDVKDKGIKPFRVRIR